MKRTLRTKGRSAAPRGGPVKTHHRDGRDGLVGERPHRVELDAQNEELQRARSALEESHHRYLELYDHAPVGYATIDPGGRILECNLAVAALLGLKRQDALRKRLSSFMSQSDGDRFQQFRHELFACPGRETIEFSLHRRSGESISIHMNAVVVEGALSHARCVLFDMSALRRAEEGLRAQSSKLEAVLDTAIDAIVMFDGSGRIELFNRAAEALFGYAEAEIVGQNVRVLRHEPELVGHDDQLRRRTRSEPPLPASIERWLGVKKDGTVFPAEVGTGSWSHRGRHRYFAVLRDVSQREAAEQKLRYSEELFRQFAEHIDDVFYVMEADGRISYVSAACGGIWGVSPDVLQTDANAWTAAIHDEDRPGVQQATARLAVGDAFDEEYRVLRRDGQLRWVRDRAFPIKDEAGRLLRIIGVVYDMTAERALEDELRHAQKMKSLGSLASSVAHDFNNHLQAVLGAATVARDQLLAGAPQEEIIDSLKMVMDGAKRGGRLTAQLLAFARKQPLRPGPMRLDEVLETSQGLVKHLLGDRVQLSLELGAPAASIVADPVQVEQVLMNLGSNARDAMPNGGTFRVQTEVVKRDRSSWVRITVSDSGSGMSAETQARAFEPFFTTKEPGHGTGLGLWGVNVVVRNMGGDIAVRSEPGKGTTFELFFPCTSYRHAPASDGPPRDVDTPPLRGAVLLVEDDSSVRQTVARYLEQLGLDVIAAEDADEAQRAAESRPIDLLISDVMIPKMRGTELAERLRSEVPDLRTLFISGQPVSALSGLGASVSDVPLLEKPFDKTQFVSKVKDLLVEPPRRALPPAPDTASPAPALTPTPPPTPPQGSDKESTILVVEDHDSSRRILSRLLEQRGHRVFAVGHPDEALKLARDHRINLLLTDVRLPEMHGRALDASLRRMQPKVSTIFMSGAPDQEASNKAPFVNKPIDIDTLTALIDDVLLHPR